MTACQQQPQISGPEGGRCTQVWLYIVTKFEIISEFIDCAIKPLFFRTPNQFLYKFEINFELYDFKHWTTYFGPCNFKLGTHLTNNKWKSNEKMMKNIRKI